MDVLKDASCERRSLSTGTNLGGLLSGINSAINSAPRREPNSPKTNTYLKLRQSPSRNTALPGAVTGSQHF